MAKRPKKGMPFPMDLPYDLTSQLVDRLNLISDDPKGRHLKKELLSKFVSRETDPAPLRRSRAIEKWLATECRNEETNERIINTHEDFQILPHVPFKVFVAWCRRFIVDIIGEFPPEEALIGSFSGGASTSRKRTSSHPSLKYAGKAHVTSRCLPWWESARTLIPGWQTVANPYFGPFKPVQDWLVSGVVRPARYGPFNGTPQRVFTEDGPLVTEVVEGNVLFTVPKKSDIDRVACKEPDLNMFIQKGVGDYFRSRLRRFGINLNDQSFNRRLAWSGSVTDELATLDLSSASDSVTSELVFLLLPTFWFTLLDASRCHVTVIDGDEHRNHMFSSMGNGFTFELESLLFFAIGKTVAYFTGTKGIISIYGDDIVCPADMCNSISYVLGYLGFSLNEEKSFVSGPFRESCGGHYWLGRDITPFYIREPIVRMDQLIDVANKLRKWAEYSPDFCILNPEAESIWLWLKGHVPRCLWGGWDTSFKYQLVSNDTPEYRLYEKTDRKRTGIGGYFHWLNTAWDRVNASDGISTSSRTSGTGEFQLKRALPSTVNRLETFFYHEVCDLPVDPPSLAAGVA